MARVRVVGRRRSPGRCAICHGDLRDHVTTCMSCKATMHADCRADLGRCPTMGCAAGAKTTGAPHLRHRRAPVWARIGPYSRLIVSGIVHAAVILFGLGLLLWPVVSFHSFWDLMSTARHHESSTLNGLIFSGLMYGFVLIFGAFSVEWLRRLPAVGREVKQLLDETDPIACELRVWKESAQRKPRTFAELTGPGVHLTLELSGILPPWWLWIARSGTQVALYGWPPPGPYLIEFPDGRLALIHPD